MRYIVAAITIVGLLLACSSSSVRAQNLPAVERICRQLAEIPESRSLLVALKQEIAGTTHDDDKARLAVIYALGCFYTQQQEEARRVLSFLQDNHSTSPYLSYLSGSHSTEECETCSGAGILHVRCPRCGGTARCRACVGKGSRTVESFGWGSRTVGCTACNRTGRCKDCTGSGQKRRTCSACVGAGRQFSKTMLRETYVLLLTERKREEEEELARQRAAEDQEKAARSRQAQLVADLEAERKRVRQLEQMLVDQGRRKPSTPSSGANVAVAQPQPPLAQVTNVQWSELEGIYGFESKKTNLQKDEIWRKYKGTRVRWTGIVSSISKSWGRLQIMVKMTPDAWLSDAIVTLKRNEESKALKFSQGDRVTFDGTLSRWGTLLPINLVDGRIVE